MHTYTQTNFIWAGKDEVCIQYEKDGKIERMKEI